MPSPIMTGLAALWAGYIVYRLETIDVQHRDLRDRMIRVEDQVCYEEDE